MLVNCENSRIPTAVSDELRHHLHQMLELAPAVTRRAAASLTRRGSQHTWRSREAWGHIAMGIAGIALASPTFGLSLLVTVGSGVMLLWDGIDVSVDYFLPSQHHCNQYASSSIYALPRYFARA